jgi:dedicator of cytokinesis protein 1
MQTLEKPGDDIIISEGQYIQINKVEPIVSDRNQELNLMSHDKNISQSIVKYYRTNNVDQFKFSRPFRDVSKNWMSTSDPDNVANLWLERTIMKTEYPLPGILKWFPVESSDTFNVS